MTDIPTILGEIAAERQRQIDVEGWTLDHDDEHSDGELAKAAGCYALHAGGRRDFVHAPSRLGNVTQPRGWPWCQTWWKPKGPRHDLIRAAALIVAEIERLDRAAASLARGR
jgi:hypothetical protein